VAHIRMRTEECPDGAAQLDANVVEIGAKTREGSRKMYVSSFHESALQGALHSVELRLLRGGS